MRTSFRLRVGVIAAAVLVFAGLLTLRLYLVQIVHGNEYASQADRQYVRPNYNLYDRGTIFFTDKDGMLVAGARLKSGFTVAINPQELGSADVAYAKLANVMELPQERFAQQASKKDDPYEEIAKQVSTTTGSAIESLGLSGVQLYREQWRYYPGGTLAAHTLGFVGYKGDDYSGRYGLERYYDDVLSRPGNNLYVNFFAELFSNLRVLSGSAKQAGDVITTLEPSVQLYLEDRLKEVHTKWNARQTAGIIINPQDGSIYAMGVYPTFNPNDYGSVDDVTVFSNPLVESVYEMGSIIKPITMAAGIDSGAVTADTRYDDTGKLTLDGYTISNFDGVGRGNVDMQEVLSQSLNTGVAFVVRQMGNDVFRSYLEKFGIGQETGIDLPAESAGLVKNLQSPRDIEYATASFGQGIALTPINTVQALSVLANGGRLVTPHVGRRIAYQTGLSRDLTFPGDGEQVIKPETAEEVTRMLVKVVDEALGGGDYVREHYSVAAKTGTAQIPGPAGGYLDNRYLHSFFGYFPAYDAKFLVFLYTVEPRGVRYASQTLTEPFDDIVSFLINTYEIPPDR